MKQVLFLIGIILWSIFQARRKAMRAQQRKQAAPPMRQQPVQQRVPAPLGAVSAEENRSPMAMQSPPDDIPMRQASFDRDPDQFFQDIPAETPEQIRPLLESIKKSKRKKRETREEVPLAIPVDQPIPVPVLTGQEVYEQVAAVQRQIPLDIDSLRTFIVMHEVLGPPRFRKQHRPGVRNR